MPAHPARLPGAVATGTNSAWGGVFILAIVPWPPLLVRQHALKEQRHHHASKQIAQEAMAREAEDRETHEAFARFSSNSPLRDWLAFVEALSSLRDSALAGARQLSSRQHGAESMLESGQTVVLRGLPSLDLAPSPRLCELSADLLLTQATHWRTTLEHPPAYEVRSGAIEQYLAAMQWLKLHKCPLNEPIAAFTTKVRGYPAATDRERFLAALEELEQAR